MKNMNALPRGNDTYASDPNVITIPDTDYEVQTVELPSAEQQAADFQQWEQEMQPDREVSPMARRIENAAGRIGTFLRERAVNKAHGEALAENAARTQEAQDDAYASYGENIEITATREASERREARNEEIADAKASLRNFGRGAALAARRGWNTAKRAGETAGIAGVIAKDALLGAASTAKQRLEVRFAERAAYKENAQRQAEQDAIRESDHEAAFKDAGYMDQVHAEAFKSNDYMDRLHEEASRDSGHIDTVHTEAFKGSSYMDMVHTEALSEYQDFLKQQEATKESLRQKEYAAKLRKARRELKRRDAMNRLRTQTKEDMTKLKGTSKRFGKAIATFAKKAGRMAKGAASGALEGARAAASDAAEQSLEPTHSEQQETTPTNAAPEAIATTEQLAIESAEQSNYDPWKRSEINEAGEIIGNKPPISDRPDPRVAPYEGPAQDFPEAEPGDREQVVAGSAS